MLRMIVAGECMSVGSLIDHMIWDHGDQFPKGYASIHTEANNAYSVEILHQKQHNKKGENVVLTHKHKTRGEIEYFPEFEPKDDVDVF